MPTGFCKIFIYGVLKRLISEKSLNLSYFLIRYDYLMKQNMGSLY